MLRALAKNLLLATSTLAIVFAVFAAPHTALAQDGTSDREKCIAEGKIWAPTSSRDGSTYACVDKRTCPEGETVTADNQCVKNEQTQESNVVGQFGADLAGQALSLVSYFVLLISTFILGLVGTAFDLAILYTVFGFGTYFGASQNMLIAWGVIRDVGNIVLLFGFIFMGVLTILNLHDYPVKKTIPALIIFAVLLNFSLFAAQVVIDVSNMFSSVFYEQAAGTCQPGEQARDCAKNADSGIAGMIAQQAGVTSIFNVKESSYIEGSPLVRGFTLLGLALFVIITAVVLLAGTIMLVIRAAVLSFLMVISPLGFAGMAIPPLRKHAVKWWHTLISQSFFAPIFLLFIFISLKLTESLAGDSIGEGKGLAQALFGGQVNGLTIVLTFFVVITFMVLSLVVAKSIGAYGASYATKTAGGLVGASTIGVAGWAGRRSLGLASAGAAKAIRNSSIRSTEIGRFLATAADKGAHASFDARNLKAVGALSSAAGIDLGKGQKGGVHKEEEDAVKARLDYAKTLSRPAGDKEKLKQYEGQSEETLKKWKRRTKEVEEQKDELLAETAAERKKEAEQEAAIESARATGNLEAVEREERVLQTMKETHQRNTQKREAAMAQIDQTLAAEKEAHEKEMKGINENIARYKNSAKYEYAENLESSKNPINTFSLGGHANHEAAEKIKKEATKDKLDSIFDDLKGEMTKKGKEGGDHGADHAHTPTPKPAAAKPAGGGGDHH